MEKWFSWIKDNIPRVILILLLLIVGVPFVIYVSFKIPAPVGFLKAGPEWNEGTVLGYYGSVLSFLGTALLSMLAIYQNLEIKKEADKRTEALETEKNSPKLICKARGCSGNYQGLRCELENISNNLANKITVSNFDIYNENGDFVYKSENVKLPQNTLRGNEKFEFSFINNNLKGKNLNLNFNVTCEDKFRKFHKYKASMLIANSENFLNNMEFEEL